MEVSYNIFGKQLTKVKVRVKILYNHRSRNIVNAISRICPLLLLMDIKICYQ